MAKKKKLSPSEIVHILKNDIKENTKILTPDYGPLTIAAAFVFSGMFNHGKLIYDNPVAVNESHPKYMKSQASFLFRKRVDYFQTLEDMNRTGIEDQDSEIEKITALSPEDSLQAGLLVRMIAYDLIMLNVFYGIYSPRLKAPVETWVPILKDGNMKKSRELMERFGRENSLGQTITGDSSNRNARFILPAFCNS